jgi:hypothetical protein
MIRHSIVLLAAALLGACGLAETAATGAAAGASAAEQAKQGKEQMEQVKADIDAAQQTAADKLAEAEAAAEN